MSDSVEPLGNQPAYGKMLVGPYKVPGTIVDIKGADRSWKFEVQKVIDTSGAHTDFKGEEIAEAITVVCALTETIHWVELAAFRKIRPAKGKRPSAWDVRNAILNNNEITSIELKKFGQETYENGGWTVTFVFGEHNPAKPVQTGAATKSQAGYVEKGKSANDNADKELAALLEKVKAAI